MAGAEPHREAQKVKLKMEDKIVPKNCFSCCTYLLFILKSIQCLLVSSFFYCKFFTLCMSLKGPGVGMGMLDFVEDIFVGVKLH